MNLAVLHLKENGDLTKLENKWWYDRSECKNKDGIVSNIFLLYLSQLSLVFDAPKVDTVVNKQSTYSPAQVEQIHVKFIILDDVTGGFRDSPLLQVQLFGRIYFKGKSFNFIAKRCEGRELDTLQFG